jgi:hypothetical protein
MLVLRFRSIAVVVTSLLLAANAVQAKGDDFNSVV